MTNGVESENEFDVDEPEEVKKVELKPETNSRRQSTRLRVSRVPVIMDTGSTDDDFSDEDSDFEKLTPKKRIRLSRSGSRSKGRTPTKVARVSSTTNGQADIETPGSEENSNTAQVSGSDTEPTSTTVNNSSFLTHQTPMFQSGAFVVSKKDFKKLSDPPIWKIDGKALLQKFIPFQQDGKTLYKNTSVYSGWSNSTKHKYYPCNIAFRLQNKKERVVEFLRDKIIPDENYEDSESEAEGDDNDDDDADDEVGIGLKEEEKDNGNDDDEEDEEGDGEEEGDNDDGVNGGEEKEVEDKESETNLV